MRILAVGDFHGTFPRKFYVLIDREKIDLVVSNGDYPPFHYRKLWFKHCYGKDCELWTVIGKKKHRALVIKDLSMAEKALRKLNKLNVPVYTVLGNVDSANDDVADFYDKRKSRLPKWERKEEFQSRISKYKNIHRFDYSYFKFEGYVFIGMNGSSFPGDVKSKAFRKHKKILDNLFKKFRKENKDGKVIFVSHNIANNTNLDRISLKAKKFALRSAGKNHKKKVKERKRHYGSKLARKIIDKYHPLLHIGGHIHEATGKQKLGKTLLVNPGSAHEGKGAVIEIDSGKVKSVKFIK